MSEQSTGASTWERMVADHAAAAHPSTGSLPEHRPTAAVLACSDARVPPSLIFGQPAGSLFVVRLAGNSATAGAIASLTYAVDELGTDLVIVLGHTGCGAVSAALSPTAAPELRAVVAPIDDMLDACRDCDDLDGAVVANVRHNLRRLRRDRGPLGRAIADGTVTIRGAVHDLRSGALIDVTADTSSHPLLAASPAGGRLPSITRSSHPSTTPTTTQQKAIR